MEIQFNTRSIVFVCSSKTNESEKNFSFMPGSMHQSVLKAAKESITDYHGVH